MDDGKQDSEEFNFNGAFVKNPHKITARKSILICGITRGGTSFAASVFARVGVPFSRKSERAIGRRYEHRDLRNALLNKDGESLKKIATSFSEEYPVWAWKLPAIQRQLDLAASNIPNPHFVIILKEPLSVAARKNDIKGKETLSSLQQVMTVYQHLAALALKMEFPLFMISYDRAMSDLPAFLPEVAKFAGVGPFDMDAAIAGIREDGQRYFETPGQRRDEATVGARVKPKAQSQLKVQRRAKAEAAKEKKQAKQSQTKSPKDFAFL
jgi:hypothetical protein